MYTIIIPAVAKVTCIRLTSAELGIYVIVTLLINNIVEEHNAYENRDRDTAKGVEVFS